MKIFDEIYKKKSQNLENDNQGYFYCIFKYEIQNLHEKRVKNVYLGHFGHFFLKKNVSIYMT